MRNFKKYIGSTLIFSAICLLLISVSMPACKKETTDETVVLKSFGPMPVLRGGEVRFIGVNLDKVTSIVLPGGITITDFGTKTANLLAITIPQNAVPGMVKINTPQGEIITKTPLGFSEPLSIDKIEPMEVFAGGLITLTGDYLNLVKAVVFSNIDTVKVFVSQSRKELKLNIPANAKTTQIVVSTGGTNPSLLMTVASLVVTLPKFTSIAPATVKAGSNLTIVGTNLDLVESILLGSNKLSIKKADFVSKTKTQIEVKMPDNTMDGKVIMIPLSMVNVESATSFTLMLPTLAVTPSSVKNGNDITVSGTNLDLVDKVIFNDNKEGMIKSGRTETQLMVTVPDGAVSGSVKFTTKASKEVLSPNLTIIDPVFTNIEPVTSKAKADITLSGTNLDLITDVTFEGGVKGMIGTRSESQIMVTVPVGAKTGKITLTSKNGLNFMSSSLLTVLANLPTITSYKEAKGTPDMILTIIGTDLQLIKELIFPGNKVATAYGEKSSTKIEVYVPKGIASGKAMISLKTYEGEEGLLPELFIGGIDPVIDQAKCFFNFDGKNSWWGNSMGSNIKTDATSSADGSSYWNINGMSGTGWWDGLFFRNGSNEFNTSGVDAATWSIRFDIDVRELIMPGAGILKIRMGSFYYLFKPWDNTASGYKTTGWITVSCPLSDFKDGDKALTDPSVGGSEFGMIWASGTSVKVNMGIDNVRFEKTPGL